MSGDIVFPCAWGGLAAIDSVAGATGTSEAMVFDSLAQLDAYIAAANTDLDTFFNLSGGAHMRGRLFRPDNNIYYDNAPGENWTKWSAANPFTYNALYGMLDMTFRQQSGNALKMYFNPRTGGGGPNLVNLVIDCGDGTIKSAWGLSHYNLNHGYTTIGDKNVRVFHAGNDPSYDQAVGFISVNELFPGGEVMLLKVNSGSHFPLYLESLKVYNNGVGLGTLGGGLTDIGAYLEQNHDSLAQLYLFDASIQRFNQWLFSTGGVFWNTQLRDVILLCAMSGGNFADVVNSFVLNTNWASGTPGTFGLNQSPPYTPVGAALAQIGSLTGAGWSVPHD